MIPKQTISTKMYYHQETSQLGNLAAYQEKYYLL